MRAEYASNDFDVRTEEWYRLYLHHHVQLIKDIAAKANFDALSGEIRLVAVEGDVKFVRTCQEWPCLIQDIDRGVQAGKIQYRPSHKRIPLEKLDEEIDWVQGGEERHVIIASCSAGMMAEVKQIASRSPNVHISFSEAGSVDDMLFRAPKPEPSSSPTPPRVPTRGDPRPGGIYAIKLMSSNYHSNPGWYLGVSRSEARDRRNTHSTYVCVHEKNALNRSYWQIEEGRLPGTIMLKLISQDDTQQSGWYLDGVRCDKGDRRNDNSSFAVAHFWDPPMGDWLLEKGLGAPNTFKIKLMSSHYEQPAEWYLDSHADNRCRGSHYVLLHNWKSNYQECRGDWLFEEVTA